jgi:hypothetical protein
MEADPERRTRVVGRVVTYGVIALLLSVVLRDAEYWPFSAMRLFSGERTSSITSWEVDAVDRDGVEHVLHPSDYGPGYAGLHYFARYLDDMGDERRDAICRAWADAAVDHGDAPADRIRIYHLRSTVPDRRGTERTVVERRLRFTCAGAS